jgi:xanthine dehydrogenase accessory factor
MNELERIVREAAQLEAEGSDFLLATVVRVAGSSYRRPGARMLVAGDRWVSGCVSGGCLEGDVLLRGAHRCRAGAVVVTYDSATEDGEGWGVGLGCNGIVDVLLEHVRPGSRHEGLEFAKACFAAETEGVLVTVTQSAQVAVPVGARLAIGPGSDLPRPIVDPVLRAALECAARGAAGVVELADHRITALIERISPSPQLFLLGGGHDAAPLVSRAQSIGIRGTVIDRVISDRSRFLAADSVM